MGKNWFYHGHRSDGAVPANGDVGHGSRVDKHVKIRNLYWIAAAIIVVLIYGLLDPADGFFPKCPFRLMTGWLCPGCGSQRAIHQLLHGQIAASYHYNQLFLPTIVYAAIGAFISTFVPAKWPTVRKKFYGAAAAYTALAIILVFAVLRNVL
jgi:hypothetical protein